MTSPPWTKVDRNEAVWRRRAESRAALAREFGLSRQAVTRIVRREEARRGQPWRDHPTVQRSVRHLLTLVPRTPAVLETIEHLCANVYALERPVTPHRAGD